LIITKEHKFTQFHNFIHLEVEKFSLDLVPFPIDQFVRVSSCFSYLLHCTSFFFSDFTSPLYRFVLSYLSVCVLFSGVVWRQLKHSAFVFKLLLLLLISSVGKNQTAFLISQKECGFSKSFRDEEDYTAFIFIMMIYFSSLKERWSLFKNFCSILK
jgi:hypothetical protein